MRVIEVKAMAEVEVDPQEQQHLETKLTLKSVFSQEEVKLYRRAGGNSRLLIPRGLIKRGVDQKDWDRCNPYEFTGKLRSEQKSMVEHTLDHLEGNHGGIIKADTGTGKTVVGINLAHRIGYHTLIIVPTSYLFTQWRNRIVGKDGFTNLSDVGSIVQNTCDYEGKEFTIGMLHSLSEPGRYPEEVYSYFGLVIWDECHRVGAPTFSNTAGMFWSDYRLGLSATPRRKDGLENVFRYHIGRNVPMGLNQHLKAKVMVVSYIGADASSANCTFGGKLNLGMYAKKLTRLPSRNELLASVLQRAYNKDERRALMLTDRVQHILTIKDLLERRYDVPGHNIGIFTGNTKLGLDRRIILATYGSAGLGADLPSLNTLVLGTPRADIEQAVGRILRADTGVNPVVVDILDVASPVMQRWYGSRKNFYVSKGHEVIER